MSNVVAPSAARLVRSFYTTINAHQFDSLDEIVDPNFDPHIDQAGTGLVAFKHMLRVYLGSFSGFCNRIEQILIDGDYVTARIQSCGMHTGCFLGHAPTGRSFAVRAIEVFRVSHSRIVERWGVFDTTAMLRQLGLCLPLMVAMSSAQPLVHSQPMALAYASNVQRISAGVR